MTETTGGTKTNGPLLQSTGRFSELVRAGTPTPGGGSVAAYSGKLAACLGIMMCNLTAGKSRFAPVEATVQRIKSDLDQLAARLGEQVDADAESFQAVLAAYRSARQPGGNTEAAKAAIDSALRGAITAPYDTVRLCLAVLRLLDQLAAAGNPSALTDVAAAGQLAKAAARSCSFIIGANLASLNGTAPEIETGTRTMIEEADLLCARIEARLAAAPG